MAIARNARVRKCPYPGCGKPLRALPCLACDGSGRERRLLLFERDCSTCAGTGRRVECPDARAHWAARLAALRTQTTVPGTSVRRPGTSYGAGQGAFRPAMNVLRLREEEERRRRAAYAAMAWQQRQNNPFIPGTRAWQMQQNNPFIPGTWAWQMQQVTRPHHRPFGR